MLMESFSDKETQQIAYTIAANSKPGDLFCLCGELGVGKTVFSKGFARGLGITEEITSPTFSIVQVYEGTLPLYHFDVYRIQNEYEMEDTGYEDYFFGQGVCLVEWATLIPSLIPNDATWITIEKDLDKGFDYRSITIQTQEEKERKL